MNETPFDQPLSESLSRRVARRGLGGLLAPFVAAGLNAATTETQEALPTPAS